MIQAEAYASKGMQQVAADGLNQAIETAKNALQGIGKDDDGNTIYNENALNEAYSALVAAMAVAEDGTPRANHLRHQSADMVEGHAT